MIKILGDKIIRDSKVFVLKIGKYVLKIPLLGFAREEMREERIVLREVKGDSHFSEFLVDCKYYFFDIQLSPYFISLSKFEKKDDLMAEYFNDSFKDFSGWDQVELKKIIELDYFLNFIKKYSGVDDKFWNSFINKIHMPLSSAHGDFYPDNILVTERGKLFFIDWIRYDYLSSRYFDLFDYYIFSRKEKTISWIEFFKIEYESGKENLLGIDINKDYFLSYGIWKMSKEIKMLEKRKKMTKQKIKKYLNFIKYLSKTIYENKLYYPNLQQKRVFN